MIVQRALGAKNEAHARGGALLCGALKILPVFVLVLPGLIARTLYPDINGDDAYPTLIIRLLPPGMVGFMVAALMAALMSSLAATFNSASTLVTFDVYKKMNPTATEHQLVSVGRIVTVVMVGLSMLWVPFIKYLSSEVYIYLQSVQAYISPPIAAVFLVGILWPRANRYGATTALLIGAVLGALRFIFELNRSSSIVTSSPMLTTFVTINFLHFAILIFAISLFVLIAVSLVTQPESLAKLKGLTFRTLDDYRPADAYGRSQFTVHAVATAVLAAFVIGLWVHFG
jgi:SSS family solute:Na+ symporter